MVQDASGIGASLKNRAVSQERYFDQAKPDNDAHNAAISRADRERYGAELLIAAPFIILDRLRQMVIAQTLNFRDDAEADNQLVGFGLYHLAGYASLIKAFGAGGVASISTFLPTLQDEDAAALTACALGLLADSSNPMIRMAVQSAASTLQQDIRRAYVDFEQMRTGFVHSLREGLREEAGRPQSPLYNRFAVDRLERVSLSQEELVALSCQILAGQREALERWKGLDEQFARLLSALEQALGQRAVSIGEDATGSIIITGDNARITIPDGGLLASRWQAFLREPQQALQQYLSIVADLYQHLYFPLGRIAGPLRLDEVYTPLALIKPASIESLLRHRGAGAPPGKRIRRVDKLFRYGKPAALAGILGAGKTTTLQYLAWVYARRPENRSYWGRDTLIPFYVYARDLAACWDERAPFLDALAQAAVHARGRQLLDPLLVKSVLHDALEQKVALILIDALDEFRPCSEAERKRFITALQAQWAIPLPPPPSGCTNRPPERANRRCYWPLCITGSAHFELLAGDQPALV